MRIKISTLIHLLLLIAFPLHLYWVFISSKEGPGHRDVGLLIVSVLSIAFYIFIWLIGFLIGETDKKQKSKLYRFIQSVSLITPISSIALFVYYIFIVPVAKLFDIDLPEI